MLASTAKAIGCLVIVFGTVFDMWLRLYDTDDRRLEELSSNASFRAPLRALALANRRMMGRLLTFHGRRL